MWVLGEKHVGIKQDMEVVSFDYQFPLSITFKRDYKYNNNS